MLYDYVFFDARTLPEEIEDNKLIINIKTTEQVILDEEMFIKVRVE